MTSPAYTSGNTQLRLTALWRIGLLMALYAVSIWLQRSAGSVVDAAVMNVYGILTVAYLAAVVLYVWLRRQPEVPARVAPLTVAADVAVVSALTAYSGGADSIFGVLYIIVILEAAALSGMRASLLAATAVSAAYTVVAVLHPVGDFAQATHLRIGVTERAEADLWAQAGLRIFAFYLVALLSGHLARRIGRLEREQENLLENFATGYLAADRDGQVTFINQAGRRILGRNGQPPIGAPLGEILRTDPPGRNPVSLSLRLRKEFSDAPCMHWRPDGASVPLKITTAFIRTGGHEVGGVMAHFSDQTLVRELQEKLRMQDRLALAGELSASLAHEVRNPVAAICGAAQELQSDGDEAVDPLQRQLMGIIMREADQLNHVVTHFLDYARVSVQESSRVDLSALLDEVVDLLRRDPVRAHAVTIDTQYLTDRAEVAADAALLKEAFLNIAQNAVDAMPDGGALRIATRPATRPGLLEVLFEDTGLGMTEDDLQNIFQPFFTTKSTGTGLGLAIVHRIIEAHGGEIHVSSRPGVGTQMRVWLPAAD